MGYDVPTADAVVFVVQALRFVYRSDIRIDDLPDDPGELTAEMRELLTSSLTVEMTDASRDVVMSIMEGFQLRTEKEFGQRARH